MRIRATFDVESEKIPRKQRSSPKKRKKSDDDDDDAADVTEVSSEVSPVFPRCVTCDVYFRYESHFIAHLKEEHGIYFPFVCDWEGCGAAFHYKPRLERHLHRIHGVDVKWFSGRKYGRSPCGVCGVLVRGIAAWDAHVVRHHPRVKMIRCPHCSINFKRKEEMLAHEKDAHMDVFKCGFCNTFFPRTDMKMLHEKRCRVDCLGNPRGDLEPIQDEYKHCHICGVKFPTYVLLRDHQRFRHPGAKAFECPYCQKSFSSVFGMELHAERKHPDRKKVRPSKKHRKNLTFTCERCGLRVTGVLNYESHAFEAHPGEKVFHCSFCSEGFTRKNSMDRHLRDKHGQDYWKRCAFCSKCYNRWDNLRKHEFSCREKRESKDLVAVGDGWFFCKLCRKRVRGNEKRYRQHVQEHDSYDQCPHCGERFNRERHPEALVAHIERRHPFQDNIAALLKAVRDFRDTTDWRHEDGSRSRGKMKAETSGSGN